MNWVTHALCSDVMVRRDVGLVSAQVGVGRALPSFNMYNDQLLSANFSVYGSHDNKEQPSRLTTVLMQKMKRTKDTLLSQNITNYLIEILQLKSLLIDIKQSPENIRIFLPFKIAFGIFLLASG